MSAHVPPHRWADAFAGKVSDDEHAAMDRHAEACQRCARAKARIARASDSFQHIRTQSSPELSWDSVRARVHWHVSTERHAKVRAPGTAARIVGWTTATAAVAAAIVAGVVTGPLALAPSHEAVVAVPIAKAQHNETFSPAMQPAMPEPLIAIVNRATGDVMIDGILARDLFSRRLAAGTTIATSKGSVDVQFAAGTGFSLGPGSMLELRKLDSKTIELVVEGMIDVEVAPRATDQTFVVIAGDRIVEVRGTQFRIRHDAKGTFVACRHGLVALRDAKGSIELPAERRVEVAAGRDVATETVAKLTSDELAELASATPMTLAPWGNLDALVAGSAPLEIATVGRREVRVDGVELGTAPLQARVLLGRHTVEVADSAGRYRRAGWVDVTAASGNGKPARLEIAADPPPTRAISERRRQLLSGMDRAKLSRCTRAIAKSGLTNTYVQIEIAIDANGAVNFLNVIDTDLPNATASCVGDTLKEIRFGKGAAATFRERIEL